MTTQSLHKFVASFVDPLSWDTIFDWPPDVFALTAAVLKRTGAYRYVVCPPEGNGWPPDYRQGLNPTKPERDTWGDATRYQADLWNQADHRNLPALVDGWKRLIEQSWNDVTLEELTEPLGGRFDFWPVCEALIGLHCVADTTCRGFGTPMSPNVNGFRQFMADHILSVYGSLSRLPKSKGIVLPKMRTPQTGISLRALSLYATWHETEVSVEWRSLPLVNPDENTINVLIVPWPEEIHPRDFQTSIHPKGRREAGLFRYFEYMPKANAGLIPAVVTAIRDAGPACSRVHAVVLPELALTSRELTELKKQLTREFSLAEVPRVIVSGVRTLQKNGEEHPCNDVVLSVFFAGRWYDLRQSKHHRWKLDTRQVGQYSIGGVLASHKGWWEHIDVGRRSLSVLAPTGWLAVSPLICEDLAQLEPVSEVIRGIGPNLLVALLLDGPQLPERWAARYASVLADDPGTSVLTVTALGMAKRSRVSRESNSELDVSTTVASWRDAVSGFRPIPLRKSDHSVLLTLTAQWIEEWTADGRSDGGAAARFVLSGVQPIPIESGLPSPHERTHQQPADSAGGAQRVFRGMQKHERDMAADTDTLEATTFAQAVDASLDVSAAERERICRAARTLTAATVIEAIGNADWPLEDGDTHSPDYEHGLVFYQKLLADIQHTSEPGGHGRWAAVIDKVDQEFRRLGIDEKAQQGKEDAEESDLTTERTDIAVLSTLLWAVHNRLEVGRFDGSLTHDGAVLLDRVQRLLVRI